MRGLEDVEVVDGKPVAAFLIPRAVTAGELLFDDGARQAFDVDGDTSYVDADGRPTQASGTSTRMDASARSGRRPIEPVTACSGSSRAMRSSG
jgi:hypothetical protein